MVAEPTTQSPSRFPWGCSHRWGKSSTPGFVAPNRRGLADGHANSLAPRVSRPTTKRMATAPPLTMDEQEFAPPITNHQSPITNHQSPITSHFSPITFCKKGPALSQVNWAKKRPTTMPTSTSEKKWALIYKRDQPITLASARNDQAERRR